MDKMHAVVLALACLAAGCVGTVPPDHWTHQSDQWRDQYRNRSW